MIAKINPVSLFNFGTANAIRILLIQDDLESSATFFWQIGKLVTPEKITVQSIVDGVRQVDEKTNEPIMITVQPPDNFVGADNVTGNVTISGDEYKKWPGSNTDVPAVIASKVTELKFA
jgi:hypothetical protein